MKVGVVIPFYQRESGILPRALDSIAAQDLPPGVSIQVVVVDDASPVPAESELAGRGDSASISWTVLKQPNAGPGAARNTGIDWLQQRGVDCVAFLDSDDAWRSDHLARGLAALEKGADFYFSDNSREGHFASFFRNDNSIAKGISQVAALPSCDKEGIRFFEPFVLGKAIVQGYLAQTSTVILRNVFLGQRRFDAALRFAGEDYFMWIHLIFSGARVAISDEIEVTCGSGLNMYFGSFDWNSPTILNRVSSEILFRNRLLTLPLGDEARAVARQLRRLKRFYAFLFLKRLALRRLPDETGLNRVMQADRLWLIKSPLLAIRFYLSDRRQSDIA